MTLTLDHLTDLLSQSRFSKSVVKSYTDWSGESVARVEWSWIDAERKALVEFLRSAGFDAVDQVAYVAVTQKETS